MELKDFDITFSHQRNAHEKSHLSTSLASPSITTEKAVNAISRERSSTTAAQQLTYPTKNAERVNTGNAIKNDSKPDYSKNTSSDKVQCPRCEFWFYSDDYESHKSVHSSQILDWLYLGGYRNSTNLKELTVRTQIEYILNVSVECENSFPGEFVYKKYDLEDSPEQDISGHFEEACEFLEEARKKCKRALVHCIQGISRSSSFVIAYLIMKQGMTLRQAYDLVVSKRSIVKPNRGFLMQLIKFEVKHRGASTMTEHDIHPPHIHAKKLIKCA